MLQGKELFARADKGPRRSRLKREANTDETLVYIGGLPSSATTEAISDLFATVGIVSKIQITRPGVGDQPGWGTVQMSSVEEAKAAISGLHESDFQGNSLIVEPLKSLPRRKTSRVTEKKPEAEAQSSVLFIGNLSVDADSDDLVKLCSAHGEVKDARILKSSIKTPSRRYEIH